MKQATLYPLKDNEEIVERNGKQVIVLKTVGQVADQLMPDAMEMVEYWNLRASNLDNKLIVFKLANNKGMYKTAIKVIKGLNDLNNGHFFDNKYTVAPIIGRYTPHSIKISLTKIRRPITVKGFHIILDTYLKSVKRQKKISLYNFMFGNSQGPENAHYGSPFVKQLYKLLTGRIEQRTYKNPEKWAGFYKHVYWFLEEVVGTDWENQLDQMSKEDFAEKFFTKQLNLINDVERPYVEYDPSKWILHDPFIKDVVNSWRNSDPPLFYFLSDKFFEYLNKYSMESDF